MAGNAPKKGLTEQEKKRAASTANMTAHQKTLQGSGFADTTAQRRRDTMLAVGPAANKPVEAAVPDEVPTFDGRNVPPELTERDVWKAVKAPLQSKGGERSAQRYTQVVLQFGLTVNPRYVDDAPGKGRGHIFVWDVSRAMNCEIPHFLGVKEMNLGATCDWIRHEGPMRGWKHTTSEQEIYLRAQEGFMVVALPRDPRTKQVALVLPQKPPADNQPLLTGVCLARHPGANARVMFGARAIDCLYHE